MIKKKDIKKLYSKYDSRVVDYMFQIYSFLETKFNEVNESWQLSLDLLASNIDMYVRAEDLLQSQGLLITDRFNVLQKNPVIKVMNDSQIQIQKILDSFGLTLKALSKLKTEENEDDSFLQELMGD